LVAGGSVAVKDVAITDDLLTVGLYTVTDASRIVSQALKKRVPAINLRRWSEGRRTLQRDYASIIGARFRVAGTDAYTFTQLVELLTIALLREKNFPLRKIRYAYERGQELFGPEPFASREYSIKGKRIFEKQVNYVAGMEDLTSGQLAFETIVKPLLHDIVIYEGDRSRELTPLGKHRSVVLNPSLSYGSPVNRDTGIPTSILYGMFISEGGTEASKSRVALWYRVSTEGVQDAVEYETALLAAA
jgi:uncharacterized protein (DUF433 family)